LPEEQEEQEQPEEEEPDEPSLIETRPTEQPRKRGRGRPPKDKGSPAVQRQPKPAKSKAKSKGSSALGIPRPKKSGVTIPVVVHRLTRPITYEETEEDADILNEKIPFAKRTGVNAVDVLAQFCDEIVDSALTALEEGGSTAEDAPTRREYNTKLKAVEAFGEELRTRLLELVSICSPFSSPPLPTLSLSELSTNNSPRPSPSTQTTTSPNASAPRSNKNSTCAKTSSPSAPSANRSRYEWTKSASSTKDPPRKRRMRPL
jgi:hypothetical protein